MLSIAAGIRAATEQAAGGGRPPGRWRRRAWSLREVPGGFSGLREFDPN
jgi:hypothetical protein